MVAGRAGRGRASVFNKKQALVSSFPAAFDFTSAWQRASAFAASGSDRSRMSQRPRRRGGATSVELKW